MAERLNISPQLSSGPSPTALAALVWTTLDDANGSKVQLTGREMIFLRGLGTVTLVSTPDGSGRVQDIEHTLTGDNPVFAGPFGLVGWRQNDTPVMHIDSDADMGEEVQIAVVTVY